MPVVMELYTTQVAWWPEAGRQILAGSSEDAVIVCQANCPATGHFAALHKHSGDEFSLLR